MKLSEGWFILKSAEINNRLCVNPASLVKNGKTLLKDYTLF